MLIRKVILMLALGLICSSAMAEWTEIAKDDVATEYANLDSIRTNNNVVKMWTRSEYTNLQDSGSGILFKSSKRLNEYDCRNENSRILALVSMAKTGEVVDSVSTVSDWKPVVPDSISEVKWKIACGKQ